MRLRFTRLALSNLKSAFDYISEHNPKAAGETVERVERSLRSLTEYPLLGRKGRVKGMRELIVPGTPFIAAYRVGPDSIEVLAVVHASRRWPERFD